MKKCILHVGFHKTATSSIQQTLAANQEPLKDNGFYYHLFKLGKSKVINHSIPFYSCFCKKPELYHVNAKMGLNEAEIRKKNTIYNEQIGDLLKCNNDIIISGEDISVLHKEALQNIKKIIEDAGFSLEVYCAVRKPYSFACSELQERIKSGISSLDGFAITSKINEIKKLKNVFGKKITFFSFEKDCTNNPVNEFLIRIGLDPSFFNISSVNEGLGNCSTRALAFLNMKYPILKDGLLNPSGRSFFAKSVDTEKFLLNEKELVLVEKQLDRENAFYKEHLGVDFCDNIYTTSKKLEIQLDEAVKIYNEYSEEHTSKALIYFIKNNSSFDILELSKRITNNASFYRDIALIFEDKDLNISIEYMNKAHLLRKNGPLILKKQEEYNKKKSMLRKESFVCNKNLTSLLGCFLKNDSISVNLLENTDWDSSESKINIIADALIKSEASNNIDEDYIACLSEFSLMAESVSLIDSFKLMATAKRLIPNEKEISKKLGELEKKILSTLKVGIGIVTYNRIDLVKKAVKSVKMYTTGNYSLVVADDGSSDGTKGWCKDNEVKCISGNNKGVVRNKNRALYYLHEIEKCDVTILIEDDCFPNIIGWQSDWILSAILWGHVNYAHKRIIRDKNALLRGDGSYLTPYIAKLVTGQCTACSSESLKKVGYLNSLFVGYGAGHVEWTERFLYHGYNGSSTNEHVFPAINTGITSSDAPTYKDEQQLIKNKKLRHKLSADKAYKFPWGNENERLDFLGEFHDA